MMQFALRNINLSEFAEFLLGRPDSYLHDLADGDCLVGGDVLGHIAACLLRNILTLLRHDVLTDLTLLPLALLAYRLFNILAYLLLIWLANLG